MPVKGVKDTVKLEFLTSTTDTIADLKGYVEAATNLKTNQFKLIFGSAGSRKATEDYQRVWAYKLSSDTRLLFHLVQVENEHKNNTPY